MIWHLWADRPSRRSFLQKGYFFSTRFYFVCSCCAPLNGYLVADVSTHFWTPTWLSSCFGGSPLIVDLSISWSLLQCGLFPLNHCEMITGYEPFFSCVPQYCFTVCLRTSRSTVGSLPAALCHSSNCLSHFVH